MNEDSSRVSPEHVGLDVSLHVDPQRPVETPRVGERVSGSTSSTARARAASGKRLALLGRFEEAVAVLEDVVAADPRNADAHRTLGVCYAKLGDNKRAARHYMYYLSLQPDAPDVAEVRKALQENLATR